MFRLASLRQFKLRFPTGLAAMLIISQILALVWWLVAIYFRSLQIIPVWYDQETVFLQVSRYLFNPYAIPRFLNPPWAILPLLPFNVLLNILSLHWAVLAQLCLYFALLTGVIRKLGGSTGALLLALTSFIALDSALELNIDWVICVGILAPPIISGPWLLMKPQSAMGFWLSLKFKTLLKAILVALIVLLISLILWPLWPSQIIHNQQTTLSSGNFNVAPMALLSVPVSIGIGLVLSWLAFRRRDAILGILAWPFFVPYIALYSLLLHFAVFAVRYPRVALLITVVMWILYGRFALSGLLRG